MIHFVLTAVIVCTLGFHYLSQLSFTTTTDWTQNYGDRDKLLGGYMLTGEYPKIEDDGPNDQFYRVKYWHIMNNFS